MSRPTDPARAWPPPSAEDAKLARILSNACGVRESACLCPGVAATCWRAGAPRIVTIDQCRACPASGVP